MLEQYITENRIFIQPTVFSWKEAVTTAAQPLLDDGIITPQYTESIFTEYEKTGPYFVIAPGIALPHSRPENGANENGLSLLAVRDGIDFGGDNEPVTLIVMLAAKDKESHLTMLSHLAAFLGDDDAVQKVTNADSVTEISQIIQSF